MRARLRRLVPLATTLAVATVVLATTWVPSDVKCPVCHTENKFRAIASYGTYVYGWPSKFQLVYWPRTDRNVVYTCKKCYLSLFMWDFNEFPEAKAAEVKKVLAGVKPSRDFAQYTDLPTSERLAIAEKLYQILDKDQRFWCDFYRVQGYHFALEKKQAEAEAARRKALLVTEKMMTEPANAGHMKELLLIRGAMHHFVGEDDAARRDLEAAQKAIYFGKELTEDKKKNINQNLDSLIREYLERLATKTVPKDDGTDPEPPSGKN